MNSYTLVTAIYDIGRDEWISDSISRDDYAAHMKRVLSIQAPMVIFCEDDDVEAFINECRGEMPTHCIRAELEKLPFTCDAIQDQIAAIMDKDDYKDGLVSSPVFTEPIYTGLLWNKTIFLQMAVNANPFETDHFCWMNAGMSKAALTDEMVKNGLFPNGIRDKVSLHCVSAPSYQDFDKRFFKKNVDRFRTDIITGSQKYLLEYASQFQVQLRLCLLQGIVASDKLASLYVYLSRPDLFDLSFGSPDKCLENYDKCTEPFIQKQELTDFPSQFMKQMIDRVAGNYLVVIDSNIVGKSTKFTVSEMVGIDQLVIKL